MNSIISIQYIKLEYPPVGEFTEMNRQQDAMKKKNKNKDNSNISLKVGISPMRHERSKKNSVILS